MLKDPLPDLASICSFSNSSHHTLVAIGLHQPSQDIFHDILAEGWHSRLMKLFFFRNQKVFHYCKCSVVDKLGWEINNHVTSSSGDYGPKPETKPIHRKPNLFSWKGSSKARLPNWQNRANDYGGFLCTTAFGRSTTTTKSGGCDRQWEAKTVTFLYA